LEGDRDPHGVRGGHAVLRGRPPARLPADPQGGHPGAAAVAAVPRRGSGAVAVVELRHDGAGGGRVTSGGGASNVAILATLDTKRAEAELHARVLQAEGIDAVLLDMTPDHVLRGQRSAERGETMSRAAAAIRDTVVRAAAQDGLAGIVALGGASGAALAAGALTALPYGTPKVLVSPIASGDTRPYVGASDVVTLHPV